MKKIFRTILNKSRGFTLIETLAAISLLMVAVVAPMSLTVQSLSAAIFARDQITAYYLAQEGLEAALSIQDDEILQIAENTGSGDVFGPLDGYAQSGHAFTIDPTQQDPTNPELVYTSDCQSSDPSACGPLQTNGTLYSYRTGWTNTPFTRSLQACYVESDGSCATAPQSDELRITVMITWETESYKQQSFLISEDLYRWVENGAAVQSS